MSAVAWKGAFTLTTTLAVAGWALVSWGPTGAWVDAQAGTRALRDGAYEVAVERLERAVGSSATVERRYHLGSALLGAERFASGAHELELVLAEGCEPELCRRALHNLALARLREAMAASPGGRRPLGLAAVMASRSALRLAPDAAGTRRNLALAERLVSSAPPAENRDTPRDDGGRSLGDGGGGDGTASGGPASLTPSQARGILDALRSSEAGEVREVLARLFERGDRSTTGSRGPPW